MTPASSEQPSPTAFRLALLIGFAGATAANVVVIDPGFIPLILTALVGLPPDWPAAGRGA